MDIIKTVQESCLLSTARNIMDHTASFKERARHCGTKGTIKIYLPKEEF